MAKDACHHLAAHRELYARVIRAGADDEHDVGGVGFIGSIGEIGNATNKRWRQNCR